MNWIANLLVALVAALHVYFLVLEMFLWTKPLGLKTFQQHAGEGAGHPPCSPPIRGCITAFFAAGEIWGLVQAIPGFAFQIKVFFLLCVIVAGVYGAATVAGRKILLRSSGSCGPRANPALDGVRVQRQSTGFTPPIREGGPTLIQDFVDYQRLAGPAASALILA